LHKEDMRYKILTFCVTFLYQVESNRTELWLNCGWCDKPSLTIYDKFLMKTDFDYSIKIQPKPFLLAVYLLELED